MQEILKVLEQHMAALPRARAGHLYSLKKKQLRAAIYLERYGRTPGVECELLACRSGSRLELWKVRRSEGLNSLRLDELWGPDSEANNPFLDGLTFDGAVSLYQHQSAKCVAYRLEGNNFDEALTQVLDILWDRGDAVFRLLYQSNTALLDDARNRGFIRKEFDPDSEQDAIWSAIGVKEPTQWEHRLLGDEAEEERYS